MPFGSPLQILAQSYVLAGILRVALASEKTFSELRFVSAEKVDGALRHPCRVRRDEDARREYRDMAARADVSPDDVFVLDLTRWIR